MIGRDDETAPPPPRPKHLLGEPLDALSIEDLRTRVEDLRAEIERLEAAVVAKTKSRAAADAFFKR